MSAAFIAIITLFLIALYVRADLSNDLKQRRPVCGIDFEEDESIASFRKFINPKNIEAFLQVTLADDDRVRRYEVYHSNPRWVAMFVNIVEKASGKSHFVGLSKKGNHWIPFPIKEKEFKKWKNVCTL